MYWFVWMVDLAGAGSTRPATTAEIDAALFTASQSPLVAERVKSLLAEQFELHGPVALIDGTWVFVVDTGAILRDPTVGLAVDVELGADGLAMPPVLERDLGLAYVPQDALDVLGVDWTFGDYTDLASSALASQTDLGWASDAFSAAYDFLFGDNEEYANRLEGEREAAYWNGRRDGAKVNDPKLDSDGDSQNNQDDDDDDNDGVKDCDDHYPFDKDRDICDLCGTSALAGFTRADTFVFVDAVDSELFTEMLVASVEAVGLGGERSALILR